MGGCSWGPFGQPVTIVALEGSTFGVVNSNGET
jgi:hypothetical protein